MVTLSDTFKLHQTICAIPRFLDVYAFRDQDPERRGRKKPVDKAQAMQELRVVNLLRAVCLQVSTLKPNKFEPTIVRQTDDYLYAEFQSPTFGFIDDVEFFFTGIT